ncbi:TetR/AcrR family transcriptional regulator [Clavibacter tessellarius]
MTFQRARNDEQRQIRRQAILDTAAGMLQEMTVAEVTLNELSRRVGLAKSNVLRYFESREAVLLDLMDDYFARWLVVLETELGDEARQEVDACGACRPAGGGAQRHPGAAGGALRPLRCAGRRPRAQRLGRGREGAQAVLPRQARHDDRARPPPPPRVSARARRCSAS